MSATAPGGLRTRRVLGPSTLGYFYRRRLRAHGTQELLAGVGIAVAVALVLAAAVAQSSIAGSTRRVLHAVIGPANLQLRARAADGFPETLLPAVEAIPGVRQTAPLLERQVRIIAPTGRAASVYLAGTDVSLGVLDGLGRTLPLSAETQGTISLTDASAHALGLGRTQTRVRVLTGGESRTIPVSTILGPETVGGTLAGARVAVMPLASMQSLLGQPGRVSRILVYSAPDRQRHVTSRLQALAKGRLEVAGAEQDIQQLTQALHPSSQASTLFAIIGALLGLLLAFNAILLTVPERRQAIADLRLSGTPRGAIIQLAAFQALCLGVAASVAGIGVGYLLARWVFHQSTGYLAEAFALSGATVIGAGEIAAAAAAGLAVTLIASAVPLLDLRGAASRDAVYLQHGVPGNALSRAAQRTLGAAAITLAAAAILLYASDRAATVAALVALAVATVLAVPIAFSGVLAGARALSARARSLSTLAIALNGLRATTVRSIALAATGAVALFGGVALGGARGDLLAGIRGFAHSYAADAPVWVSEPGDNQATGQLEESGHDAAIIGRLPGVGRVERFQGAFLTIGARRVWVIARPPGGARDVLESQSIGGPTVGRAAERRLGEGDWVTLSEQLASALHARAGGNVTLPTPSGPRRYRVAALTTNLAWIPGVIFISSRDYTDAWAQTDASALAVHPAAGLSASELARRVRVALGAGSGLEVVSAAERQSDIDRLTSEGLGQLGTISTLLIIAAILALAAALASSIHQRRRSLASLRLSGAPPGRLRRILLAEAALMLAAGCLTGLACGVCGQLLADGYLRHVTNFPIASFASGGRPIEVLAIVLAAALGAVAAPAWAASRVSPALALAEY